MSAVSYWHPVDIVMSAWIEHAPFAFWLMSELRPKTVAELGTHNGYSFFVFCEAARRLDLDTRLFAVDTWEGDEHAGFYDDSVYQELRAAKEARYGDSATLLRGYFDDFVGDFAPGSVGLLHIDGRHGYDDIKHDFESWLPSVASGGVVLFHDIAVHERDFGVWQFWDELQERFPSFGFTHGNGLGVIGVGTPPPALAPFFDASDDEAERIRDFYAELGAVLSAEFAKDVAHQQVVDDILGSFSWRAGAPLRAITGAIPGRLKHGSHG